MNEREVDEMKKLLRGSLSAMRAAELRGDLWPEMLRRLDRRFRRVPWWDWALMAAVAAMIFLVPGIIPALLYHL
jgi:hypothetical protein